MCYSAMVKEDIRKLERAYNAHISWDDFLELYRQRERDQEFSLKIPGGMDSQLIALGGTAAKEIQKLCNSHRVAERAQREEAVAAVLDELIVLEATIAKKPTKTAQTKLDAKLRKLKKLHAAAAKLSVVTGDYRIFPFQFAPVIIQSGAERLIVPMRFQILPRWGKDTKYDLFNARRDSLQVKKTWIPLFGKTHALFPFEKFFERVGPEENRVEIAFTPDGYESMWAAALYDEFKSSELGIIRSFAMVTDEPPPEVAAAGHDRCPVFIDRTLVADWLAPAGQSLEQLDALLGRKQPTHYSHALAA